MTKEEELVRQMLAKAESSTFPAEKESFQAAAEKLIIKHKLDRDRIMQQDEAASVYEPGSVTFSFAGQYGRAKWFVDMAALGSSNIAVALGYYGIIFKSRRVGYDETKVWADKEDLAMIEDLCRHIAGQCFGAMERWWKEEQRDQRGGSRGVTAAQRAQAKYDFAANFYAVACDRIREERQRQEREATKGNALVLSSTRYIEAAHSEHKIKQAKSRNTRDYEAELAGQMAGQEADVQGIRRIQ